MTDIETAIMIKNMAREMVNQMTATVKNMKYRVYFRGGRTKDVEADNRVDVIRKFSPGEIEALSLISKDGSESLKEKVSKEDSDYWRSSPGVKKVRLKY